MKFVRTSVKIPIPERAGWRVIPGGEQRPLRARLLTEVCGWLVWSHDSLKFLHKGTRTRVSSVAVAQMSLSDCRKGVTVASLWREHV